MYTASKLIAIAEAEVGYLEKETNSQLDSKLANAGDENYTKYARDLKAAGYYNGNKNGYAWCDVFVDWCHYMAANKDAKLAQDTICQTGSLGAGCKYSARYYRNAGRFHTSPKVGDQIFFGKTGDETHTGIVYKVDSTKVYTIEGNTSSEPGVVPNGGAVRKKSYKLNYSKIVGYGRPKYEEAKAVCTVEINVLRLGSKGDQVKTLQILLNAKLGDKLAKPLSVDGDFGKNTLAAVELFQKLFGLTIDGIVGRNTWNKLLGIK
jgi:peptidoglycan hydrolase-like protein with peptidoglycan-binding domain